MDISTNLAEARDRSGLGQQDVANALGVSRAMVSYWEAGSREPSDRQLAALARLLRTPIGTILGTQQPAATPDVAAMLLRGADRALPDDALPGLREFSEFLETYAELADAANFKIRGLEQSPFVGGADFDTADDARRKAEEVRAYLRIGLGPIGDLDALCELLGITVYRAPLGADLSRTVSGAFYNHPEVHFSILVNLDMTPGRRRFTIAHELAHALFHSDSESYIVSTAGKPPRERFADAFAGEFLMPAEGVRRVMEEHGFGPRITDPTEVIYLQRFFGVSWVTALVRLRQAKYLAPAAFADFQSVRPVLLARSLGFEISDEEFGFRRDRWRLERFPSRFRRLVRRAVLHDVISVPTAAAMTGLSIDEISDLVDGSSRSGPEDEQLTELAEYAASGIADSA